MAYLIYLRFSLSHVIGICPEDNLQTYEDELS